ncbi:MAG: hypothetical protein BroJett018_32860 [Chloroflexota bacterium]|nr:MAG: hypothetical protein BroJett018_32860 [Chloroflexota bacterium]
MNTDDIVRSLDAIIDLSLQILEGELKQRHRSLVSGFLENVNDMKRVLPTLNEMLLTETPYKAAMTLAEDWRHPLAAIRGVAALLLDEKVISSFSANQQAQLKKILSLGEQLWEWSLDGHPNL